MFFPIYVICVKTLCKFGVPGSKETFWYLQKSKETYSTKKKRQLD